MSTLTTLAVRVAKFSERISALQAVKFCRQNNDDDTEAMQHLHNATWALAVADTSQEDVQRAGRALDEVRAPQTEFVPTDACWECGCVIAGCLIGLGIIIGIISTQMEGISAQWPLLGFGILMIPGVMCARARHRAELAAIKQREPPFVAAYERAFADMREAQKARVAELERQNDEWLSGVPVALAVAVTVESGDEKV